MCCLLGKCRSVLVVIGFYSIHYSWIYHYHGPIYVILFSESTGCASKDQWKQYLPTNKLFLLTQESKSYAEAERECEVLGGSVALLKDEGEARWDTNSIIKTLLCLSHYWWTCVVTLYSVYRFAFNLTHSRNQRKRYWVGLRKFGSSVQWSDGSNFDQSETPRFPTGQRGKLRNRYYNWYKVPCIATYVKLYATKSNYPDLHNLLLLEVGLLLSCLWTFYLHL